ncbi:MAG: signal peptidase I, partial [Pseudomonadota bacterium]
RLLVKRVVARPGDRVALRDNRLSINGTPARYERVRERMAEGESRPGHVLYRESILGSERYVMVRNSPGGDGAGSFGPVRVPEGHFLMLGDNRDHSRDSRAIGFVPEHRILGRAGTVAFSLDHDNHYAPRLDRFLEALL